mmetsp:Transcript_13101/g.28867  ORF Transcript_13101/g.28867 Transcript_13101/m.28867 type:complete len:166 (-) Transcript_13101:256-753(-)
MPLCAACPPAGVVPDSSSDARTAQKGAGGPADVEAAVVIVVVVVVVAVVVVGVGVGVVVVMVVVVVVAVVVVVVAAAVVDGAAVVAMVVATGAVVGASVVGAGVVAATVGVAVVDEQSTPSLRQRPPEASPIEPSRQKQVSLAGAPCSMRSQFTPSLWHWKFSPS